MRCLRTLLAIIGVVLLSSILSAQNPENTPRITARIDETARVTLSGNTHPYARAEFDRGPVSPDLLMGDLYLVLQRSPSRQRAFDDFAASQYDSSSPNFHHWLTPDEIGTRFGPAFADIETISGWLRSHGFSVDEVSKDRMSIRFSGTASQVQDTFGTEIHNLQVRNEPHIANMSDPQIPAALAPVVLGVKALHNFFPRPLSRIGSPVRQNPDTGKWERIPPSANGTGSVSSDASGTRARPQFGINYSSGGTNFLEEDLSPYDWATIYNVLPLWNASSPIDGTGQKIAIAGTSNITLNDIATFRSTFGLPAKAPQVIVTNTDPGVCSISATTCDRVENTLDVEWSGAIAKNAQIILVTSSAPTQSSDPLLLSVHYIIDHSVAPVVSVSYGLCELFMGTAGNAQYASLWGTASVAGMSVFVATGDSGSPSCDQGGDNGGSSVPYAAEYGLSVNGLATTPDNTAVGGTDLNWGTTAAPYWNTSNASNGSSAKGYMPEVPWNDSCTNPLLLSYFKSIASDIHVTQPTDAESACNFLINNESAVANDAGQDLSFLVDTLGAGGGISGCTTSDGTNPSSCSGGYPQPAWQTGVSGIPSGGKRAIPDVSFFASNGFNGSAYLICITDTGQGLTCNYPTNQLPASGLEIGGTSAATPAMAGVMALINQKTGSAQGNAAPELYKLASGQTWANCNSDGSSLPSTGCYFNDITSGTITMPCNNGLLTGPHSPDCTVKSSSDKVGVLNGYDAGAAFDAATGLGSMNVTNVVNHWATFIGTASSTVTVTPNPSTLLSADSLAVTGSVTGVSGTPTGSVTLSAAGYTSSAPIQLDGSGKFSTSIPGYSFKSGGTVILTANYSGDDTYAASSGTAPLTINLSTFTLSATNVTLTAGDAAGNVSNITVAPANGYTGTVTLSAQVTSAPANSIDTPTLTAGPPVQITDSSQKHGTITVGTTAVGAARKGTGRVAWLGAAGGTALTALLLFSMPVGFRRGRRILGGLLVVVAAAFTFVGCGGGGGGGGGGGSQKSTPGVQVSTTQNTFATTDSIPVSVSVSGGTATPTGTVTLASGSYTSAATTLSNGGANITIPASTFAVGPVTLTATYSGDSNYNSATGTEALTIAKPGTTAGTYTVTVTGTGSDPAATTATTTFTLTVN